MAARRPSDIETYKRLLGYLRGSKPAIVLLFTCMVLEALFTVITISSIKPVIELLINNRVLDVSQMREGPRFDLNQKFHDADRTAAVRGRGSLAGVKAEGKLRDRVAALVAPVNRALVLDLSPANSPDAGTWGALATARLLAAQQGVDVTLILPAGGAKPPDFVAAAPHFHVLAPDDPATAPLYAKYLAAVPMPEPRHKGEGYFAGMKKALFEKVRPVLERLDAYAAQNTENKFRVLAIIIASMLLSALCMVVSGFGVGYLSSYLAQKSVNRLRNHVYSHMLGLDLAYFNSHSTGNLLSTVSQDVSTVAGAVDVIFSSVLKTPVTVMVLVGAMLVVSPQLTLFCLLVSPLMAAMIYVLSRRVRRISRRIQESRAVISGMAQETFTGIRVVKAFNMEQGEASRFSKETKGAFRRGLKATAAEEMGTGFTQLLSAVTVSFVVLYGGYLILTPPHSLSGSDFVLFIGLVTQVFRPLKNVSRTAGKIQKGLAGCDRVFDALDQRPTLVDRPGAVEAQPLREAVAFEGVTFAYARSRGPVLHDITLRVPRGKAVAIVGETGSGKSTLVNLLPRFFDPTQGRVTYDGTDLRDLKVESLRNQIAVITQDVVLFDATVAENIAYGCTRQVTREEIEAAGRTANAHDFITAKLPNGYDTQVGARGVRLSGGERQRLAIARAILKDAPIMILDEATSSLDSETEALIQEALARVIRGRTVFVIAHRLSTIQNCDEIYVMDNGRFVEHGTHDQLLQGNGMYARYYRIQFGKLGVTEPEGDPAHA